ncbi:RING-type E3 ubiquitin-protein ligase PPIL2-like [Ylistrum balloti]|uniref:RING-type E3 ubiquitin-protein ligase PPIL2-like n=1 Tax=Ylistrum balloti TaxID=509963 RepID=UPI002905E52E|nr:RING-type E3 ubiquitin-protein ligase PPIL2-like [Ylistrum balloti]
MGKKQHQKDKLYLTTTEWKTTYGGYKGDKSLGEKSRFRRLPFSCCSLSMQPFENPLCTKEGIIFDLMNIVPFLKKYGISPVTGEKMTAKQLIKLNFSKNSEGKYHCPVTFKIFNENTHISAIRTSGNVFAHEAIERLNIKPKYYRDLVTDEEFTRSDIITIQDPTNLEKFNISSFHHLKHNLKVGDEDEEIAKKNPRYHLKALNAETAEALDELERQYKPMEKTPEEKPMADSLNAAHYSTGRVAASFTSTAMAPATSHEAAIIDEDLLRYERVKKKGYLKIVTNLGELNIELYCHQVPRTCHNFLKLCASGYYTGTVFHRSIRNFIIQGGDPEGTGLGGQSIWGKPFADELKPNLKHTGRGVLSMANSGPNTNKSQFFFTYRSANHLDGKHAVFGKVVGGLDTLDKMEKVETDKKDRPKEEIKIEECVIYVNPYDEADEMLQQERDSAKQKDVDEKEEQRKRNLRGKPVVTDKPRAFKSGVGKYINPSTLKRPVESSEPAESAKKSKVTGVQFGNFSSW